MPESRFRDGARHLTVYLENPGAVGTIKRPRLGCFRAATRSVGSPARYSEARVLAGCTSSLRWMNVLDVQGMRPLGSALTMAWIVPEVPDVAMS